jgi:asparagine synthase (glutamine-hydrolysing)
MCGIFATQYNDKCLDHLNRQFDKGKHRGPESTRVKYIDNLFLGFHRVGLNNDSNQPFNIDGVCLICNGEIYNYRELSRSNSIKLITESDCEIIIHLYILYGIERTLELLDGVFSFVMYDWNTSNLFVARDPYGVRPLYSSIDDSEIYFASELKQLNELCQVKHFTPGTFRQYSDKKLIKNEKYNTFGVLKTDGNVHEIIYTSLLDAVKKRVTTTERPIACLLSGGLDSSTITAMVNSFLPRGVLETYSIGLPGSVDLINAKIVANYLGTKHTEIIVTEDDFFNSIPEVIYTIESYDTTTVRASVGNYLIGKYIKENSNAKVIFNGDGSDELTGGYLSYVPDAKEFDRECKRLHMFDVLRSDKCISSHGLEPRTPFLDLSFTKNYLDIWENIRCHSINNKCEKYLLRKSIEVMNPDLLPTEILWRTKEAFSDGVSSMDNFIQEKIPKEFINEKDYYISLFSAYFPDSESINYVLSTDPSARTLFNYHIW